MKRIFISFAVEDEVLRNLLRGQSKNDNCPFEFVDMSVKQPWDSAWKTHCRERIKGCDGVIVIITRNTTRASGEIWEVNCAQEEHIPCLGVWGHSNDHFRTLPPDLVPLRVVDWNWDTIAKWIATI